MITVLSQWFPPKENKMLKLIGTNFLGKKRFVEDCSSSDCFFLKIILKWSRRLLSNAVLSHFLLFALKLSKKCLCNYLVQEMMGVLYSVKLCCSPSLSSKSLHRALSQVRINCVKSVIRLSSLHWLLFYHLPFCCVSHKLRFLKPLGEILSFFFSPFFFAALWNVCRFRLSVK